MDITLLLKAAFMGIVEGLTEFLPISSTGHLILAGSLIGFTGETAKVFEIAIQTGAMFAVIWQYRERLQRTVGGLGTDPAARRFALNVLIAFIPAVVLGLAFGKAIKAHLFHPVPVALAFIAGGLVILWVERRHHRLYGDMDRIGTRRARIETVDDMAPVDALKVGLLQCLAMIPGTSRSGATIIAMLLLGMARPAATEFAFLVGIPTILAGGGYKILKALKADGGATEDWAMVAFGTVVSGVVSFVVVKWLLGYVQRHTFTAFGVYRVIAGAVLLALVFFAG